MTSLSVLQVGMRHIVGLGVSRSFLFGCRGSNGIAERDGRFGCVSRRHADVGSHGWCQLSSLQGAKPQQRTLTDVGAANGRPVHGSWLRFRQLSGLLFGAGIRVELVDGGTLGGGLSSQLVHRRDGLRSQSRSRRSRRAARRYLSVRVAPVVLDVHSWVHGLGRSSANFARSGRSITGRLVTSSL
jgi:hypothetical protein